MNVSYWGGGVSINIPLLSLHIFYIWLLKTLNKVRVLSQIDVLLLDKHEKILLKVIHRNLVSFRACHNKLVVVQAAAAQMWIHNMENHLWGAT